MEEWGWCTTACIVSTTLALVDASLYNVCWWMDIVRWRRMIKLTWNEDNNKKKNKHQRQQQQHERESSAWLDVIYIETTLTRSNGNGIQNAPMPIPSILIRFVDRIVWVPLLYAIPPKIQAWHIISFNTHIATYRLVYVCARDGRIGMELVCAMCI